MYSIAVSTNGKIYGQPQWSLAPSRSALIPTSSSTAAPVDVESPPPSPSRPNMKSTSTAQKIRTIRRPSLVDGASNDAPVIPRRGSAIVEGERGVVYEVVNPAKSSTTSSRLDDSDNARRTDGAKASTSKGASKTGPGRRSAGSSTDSSSKTTTSPAALDGYGVAASDGVAGVASGSNGGGTGGKLKGLKRFLGIKRR